MCATEHISNHTIHQIKHVQNLSVRTQNLKNLDILKVNK